MMDCSYRRHRGKVFDHEDLYNMLIHIAASVSVRTLI